MGDNGHRLPLPSGTALGHDVDTVPQEDAHRAARPESLGRRANTRQRLLITQDLDFSDIRHLLRVRIAAYCWYVCRIRRATAWS